MDPTAPKDISEASWDRIRMLAPALRRARRVVVFTGAGVSAESGMDTFRDQGGLWARFPPDRFGTFRGLMTALVRQPRQLCAFVRAVLEPLAHAQPNPAHHAVAALEALADVTVVTQNIDGLHQDAGSRVVHEVHGSVLEVVDGRGRHLRTLTRAQLVDMAAALAAVESGNAPLLSVVPAVAPLIGMGGRGAFWRPNLVLFGERMAEPAWTASLEAAAQCDAMLVVGTSASVYPAASLPQLAVQRGVPVVGVGPVRELSIPWLTEKASAGLPALLSAWRG